MKYFKEITTKTVDPNKQNALIMWRITWESIPDKYKPLSWRKNIVLSSNKNLNLPNWVLVHNSLENSLRHLSEEQSVENIFVMWWWSIYKQAINSEFLDKIYITEIMSDFECDTFFPNIDKFNKIKEEKEQKENWVKYRFCQYWKN